MKQILIAKMQSVVIIFKNVFFNKHIYRILAIYLSNMQLNIMNTLKGSKNLQCNSGFQYSVTFGQSAVTEMIIINKSVNLTHFS